jgi:hypothetical protein
MLKLCGCVTLDRPGSNQHHALAEREDLATLQHLLFPLLHLNIVSLVLQWCYSGVTVVSQWKYSGVMVVLQCGTSFSLLSVQ